MSEEKDIKKVIGERLRYLRKKNNLKVWKMLEILQVPRSTFTSWETGHRKPDEETIVKLAKIYDTTPDFIKGNVDDDSPEVVNIKEILATKKIVWGDREITEQQAEALIAMFDSVFTKK